VVILKESGSLRKMLKNTISLTLFFLIFYSVILTLSFLDNGTKCFPVTIITTQKDDIDKMLESLELCALSVEVEKMTFDSAVFNHYEKLPVKDIYLYSAEIPYLDWERIKNMDDAITEANPYFEKTIRDFADSKLKYLSIAFIFIFFTGLIFMVKIAPSWKNTPGQFRLSVLASSVTFFILSAVTLSLSIAELNSFVLLSLSVVFAVFLIIILIISRLLKSRDEK